MDLPPVVDLRELLTREGQQVWIINPEGKTYKGVISHDPEALKLTLRLGVDE